MPSDLRREDGNLGKGAPIPIAVPSVRPGVLSIFKEQFIEFSPDHSCHNPLHSLLVRQLGPVTESITFSPNTTLFLSTHSSPVDF
jgi:hypothetical protein